MPLQQKIDNRIDELKVQTIASIESRLSRKISYSSISPSVFLFIEVRDVVILEKESDSRLLKIGRVRVHYSIFQLLKGRFENAVKEISIVRSRLVIDVDKDKDILDFAGSFKGDSSSGFKLSDITVSGKNLSVIVKNKNNMFVLDKFFFSLSGKNSDLVFSSRGYVKTKLKNIKLSYANSKFKYSGIMSNSMADLNSRISLRGIKTNLFSLGSLSLQLKKEKGKFLVRKIEDSSPLDMEILYDLGKDSISLSVISERFNPSLYFHGVQDNRIIKDWVSGIYTTDFSIKYFRSTGDISYSGNIETFGKNDLFKGNYSINAEVSGNNRTVDFSSLKIHSPYGKYYYKGSFNLDTLFPDGTLTVRNGRYENYSFSSTVSFSARRNRLKFSSSGIILNGITLSDMEGNLTEYEGDMDFSVGFSIKDPVITDNKVTFEGNLQYKPNLSMQLSIATDDLPLNPFNKVADKINTKTMTLSTEGFLTTDFKKISFSLIGVKIEDRSDSKNRITFSSTGNNEGLSITGIKALWNKEELSGNISLSKEERDEYSARGNIIFNTYPYDFFITAGKDGIFLTGSYNLNLSVLFSDTGLRFSGQSKSFPVPLKDKVSEVSIDASGYYINSSFWNVIFDNTVIKNLPLPVSDNEVDFSGEISQDSINLKSITYTDSLSKIFGESSFDYDIRSGKYSGSLFFTDSENNEKYTGSVKITGDTIDLKAYFSGAPVERFKKSSLSGLVSGSISVFGERINPDVVISARLDNGLYDSLPLDMKASLSYKNMDLNVENFSIKYQNHILSEGTASYNSETGGIKVSALLRDNIGGHDIKTELSLSGYFQHPENIKTVPITTVKDLPFNGTFFSRNASVNGKKASDWKLSVKRDKDMNISFNGGPAESIVGQIKKNGSFNVTTKGDFPVRTEAAGQFANGKVDMLMKNTEIDLTAINMIKIENFRFDGGTAFGQIHITGDSRDPDFYGKLSVKGASVSLSYLTDPIDPFDTEISFNEKDMHIRKTVILNGDASVTTEADFTFSKWIPGNYSLMFSTINHSAVHVFYKISSIGLGIDGFADGNFAIKGVGNELAFSGDVIVDNCILTLGQMEKENGEEEPSNISLDMGFTTGKKVEVLWPSANLPILKAYTEPNQHLKVIMDGTNSTYSIKGDIAVKYGEIYYFQRNFYLTSGTIIFNENEESFDPIVDFKAQIREVDSKGEVVNVYMYLDKTPLSKFSPRFESDPALPTVEIMAMLGSNVFAQLGNEKVDITSALMLTGDLVSQFSIIRGFEQKVKNIFNLDLFSIRTQMIQNIILDRFISSGINNTSSDLFGKYLDNTTIYLGKYFGNSLFLQTMVQLGTNTSFSDDYISDGTLQIQTKVNLEWKTPLFLLDFAIEPDFFDPVSSLDNTSLSFSWGFSY